MPSISSDISVKISTLLKSMGKISDGALADAKKKYESNGETPLGLLDYLIEEKTISEDDVVAAVSRNYALRKVVLTEQTIKKDAVKNSKDFIMENEMLPFELNGRILKIALLIQQNLHCWKNKSMTGCNVELYVAKPSNLDQALKFKSVVEAIQEPKNAASPQITKQVLVDQI